MMFSDSQESFHADSVLVEVLDLLLILHADHEQNCSTSTVRMAGSSLSNIFGAVSSGISALWGPLHGGANQAVLEMLKMIKNDGSNYKKYVEKAKDKKGDKKKEAKNDSDEKEAGEAEPEESPEPAGPTPLRPDEDAMRSELRLLRQTAVSLTVGEKEGASTLIKEWLEDNPNKSDEGEEEAGEE